MIKMTNKLALEFVLGLAEVQANTEVFDKLTKMLEQNNKKNSSVNKDGEKVLTVVQKQNIVLQEEILVVLSSSETPLQAKEILANERFKGRELSGQKISAQLRTLISQGQVVRIEEKKVARFTIS